MTSMMSKGFARTRVMPTGDGSSNSYYKSVMRFHPRARAVKRISTPQHFHAVYSYRLTGSTGNQTYYTFNAGESTDMNSMVSQVTGYNNTTDIFLSKINMETVITNCSESTVFLDLYECTPRYAMGAANDPGSAANTGITDASGLTASFSSLGAVPTMSTRFTALWKIHKKYTLELAQGRSHVHKAQFICGQKWNQELYAVYGANWYLRNFSKALLMVAYGQPINDQNTKANVSTSSVAIDIVRKERFEFFYNNPTNTGYAFTSTLPAITTEYLLDIGSGEPEVLDKS